MKLAMTALLALAALVPLACGDDGPPLTISTSADDRADSVTSTSSTAESPDETGGSDEFDVAAAEAYCTDNGGMLVRRVATWNVNADPEARLELAGRATFCEFESDEEVSSRISVDLVTLYSEQPTIAAVAYLSPLTVTLPETPSANPAEYSCRLDLFASAAFGNTATVGGWVNADEPTFSVMNMCVFPDMSAIDEFGLWYHANDEIRGIDLEPILRYQPGRRLPAMFESQS
jgi:putative hemolysin